MLRQPGRRSAASYVAVDVSQQRPDPPERLSAEEKVLWRDLTERLRPDWFVGTEHLLEIYCHSLAMERFIAQQIKLCDPADEKRLATLARCQRDTAAVIATYATKMRLTQRSTFDRTAVKHVSALPKPWDLSRPFDEPGDRCWSPTLDPRRQSGIARQINQNPSWAMVRLSTASAGPVSIGGTTTSWYRT
jgi:hypothetical protein